MIREIMEKYLPEILVNQTLEELGDRKEYIGSSDVAGCPRKIILSKMENPTPSLETLIRFERGHLAEKILSKVFERTSYKWQSQFEVTHPDKPYIKSHIDFLFYTKDYKKMGIVELKTVSGIPDEPYESWIMQVQFQMGLLKLQYPDSDIKGSVVAIDLNTGQMVEFNNLIPDDVLFSALIEKADMMWDLLQKRDLKNIPTEESLLCAHCPFKATCPNFTGDEVPEVVKEQVGKYKTLSEKIKELNSKKEEIKKTVIDLVGTDYKVALMATSLLLKNQ